MNEWLLIAAVIVLSGFFSGSEIAFVSANRLKLELRARKNTLSARFLSYFVRNPDSFLSTTLIGNNIVNVAYATLMTLFLTTPIQSFYLTWTGGEPSEATMLVIQTTIASLIIMVFGEVLPKAMFRTYPDVFMAFLSIPLRILSWVFYPFVAITNGIARLLSICCSVNRPALRNTFADLISSSFSVKLAVIPTVKVVWMPMIPKF